MRTFDEILADAEGRHRIGWGGEAGAAWMSHWCDRCIHDRGMRDDTPHPASGAPGCPIVLVAMTSGRPVEWAEVPDSSWPMCTEYEPDPQVTS